MTRLYCFLKSFSDGLISSNLPASIVRSICSMMSLTLTEVSLGSGSLVDFVNLSVFLPQVVYLFRLLYRLWLHRKI